MRKTSVLWQATCFVHVTLTNHGQEPISFEMEAAFDNDFRDLFEIRGTRRAARGTILPVRHTEDGLILGYVGLGRRHATDDRPDRACTRRRTERVHACR